MFIGIDIGTSAVKALLLHDSGAIIATAEAQLQVSRPGALLSEQEPQQWWDGVCATLDNLAAGYGSCMALVRGIGLSGQMHAAVLLDRENRPLCPAILWNDARSHAEADELQDGFPHISELTGVRAMAGFTGPKMLWIKRHHPELLDRLDCLLLPKDYIRLLFTGERGTDVSDAAGTWLLDEAERDWCEQAVAAVGLRPDQLPKVQEASDVAGTILPELAARWSLPKSCIVAHGGGDCPVGGVGSGVINEGSGLISLGTSAQLFVPTSSYRPAVDSLVHSFCHALPGRWFQMGAILTGASALAWTAGICGRTVSLLNSEVEMSFSRAGDLLFLPYLAGERTPHNDPHARGVFFGLAAHTTSRDMAQAVMEGVAYTLADARDALLASGTDIPALSFLGGGARSIIWASIIAAVLERPIIRHKGGETGPALGAARLARMAVTAEDPTDFCVAPEVETIIEPNPALVDQYKPRLEQFRRLYTLLKPEFGHLAALPKQ